jgi:hypothetical protein
MNNELMMNPELKEIIYHNEEAITFENIKELASFCIDKLMIKFGFLFRIFKFSLNIEKKLFKKLWEDFFNSLTTNNFEIINDAILYFNTIRIFNDLVIETIYKMLRYAIRIFTTGSIFTILYFYKKAIKHEMLLISKLHEYLTETLPIGNFILCEFNQFMYLHDITIENLFLENNCDNTKIYCDNTKIYCDNTKISSNEIETQDLDDIPLYSNLYYPKDPKDQTDSKTFIVSGEYINILNKPENIILYFSDIPKEAIEKIVTLPNDIVITILHKFLGCLSNTDIWNSSTNIYNMTIKSSFLLNTSLRVIPNIYSDKTHFDRYFEQWFDCDCADNLFLTTEDLRTFFQNPDDEYSGMYSGIYFENKTGIKLYCDILSGFDDLLRDYTRNSNNVEKMSKAMLNMLKITKFKKIDETILNAN